MIPAFVGHLVVWTVLLAPPARDAWVTTDALPAVRIRAVAGDPASMAAVGSRCADDREVVAWYRRGAAAGYPGAFTRLCYACAHGRGVPNDDAQAVAWYRKGVAAGDATARLPVDHLDRRRLALHRTAVTPTSASPTISWGGPLLCVSSCS